MGFVEGHCGEEEEGVCLCVKCVLCLRQRSGGEMWLCCSQAVYSCEVDWLCDASIFISLDCNYTTVYSIRD